MADSFALRTLRQLVGRDLLLEELPLDRHRRGRDDRCLHA
jgi:hypothetical protein